MEEKNHDFETKYGEYTDNGYRNVIKCKYCGYEFYQYLDEKGNPILPPHQ